MTIPPPAQLATAAKRLVNARRKLFMDRDAVRLSHHEILPDLTVDTYAGHMLLTDYAPHRRESLPAIADSFAQALRHYDLPAISATVKIRPDNLSHNPSSVSTEPITILGDPQSNRFVIREGESKFYISFTQLGFGTGLFLDMAAGREWVHAHCSGRRVLNLFSYTGGFSIRAALGGASEIIEVDTSRKWLNWSRANQQLNDITTVRQRCEDAVKYLAKQDDESFDVILCDPPSYANPKRGKRFTIEAGYQQMSQHFPRVLQSDGILLACCNHAQTTRNQFKTWLPRKLKFEKWLSPAAEFPLDYRQVLKIALMRQ